MIKDLLITSLPVVDTPGGNVMHAMKKSDKGYSGFGEAYFSNIEFQVIKAWKRHKRMTLNILVPVGKIRFVFMDDRKSSEREFQEVIISRENYCRLTVPPMIWMGFQGLSNNNSFLLNIADIEHDPAEVDKRKMSEIEFNWSNQ
ncbi:MAG: dTDP-4-dehydrorhamnose 3,5-epimerase [Candidatus Marinimicrobia bacterium]|jgi:dTDP-4-dehydrorhamnose 3,5-epimerase|nr:dTDP-4-dehydrorhamnose 3,5-epimerase [Candidatus Neomarinimicrobiota bacterium]